MANWTVVILIFGGFPTIEAIIFVLVGLASLHELYFAYQLDAAQTMATSGETPSAQ